MGAVRLGQRLAYLRRLRRLLFVLGGFAVTRLFGGLLRRVPGPVGRLPGLLPPPQRFRALLEALGGTFIKFGQVLSLQPDIVPRTYCDELFDLLDRVPPFAFEDVEATFREDLGRLPGEIFDRFEARPFASASIGQVHRARLGNRELAVKIRRPTALRDFGGDIGLMKAVVWLIETLGLKSLDALRLAIREFVAWTSDELDYRTEARYMEQVRLNTAEDCPARIPAVVPHVSTARILAVDYIEGTTLLEYLRALESGHVSVEHQLRRAGFEPNAFAENIVRNFIGDVFQHGLFHADLHPANLLILPDNVIGYVDFGITGVISEYARDHVLEMILALARRDVDALLPGLLAISEITDDSDVDAFRRGVRDLADEWFEPGSGSSRTTTSYTVILLDLIKLSKQCLLLPHEEALRYMRSVITAEGLIGRFAPDFDVNAALERLSREQLQSRAMAASFSADRMVEAWIAGTRLMRHGAERLDRLLDRLEARSVQHSWEVSRAGEPRRDTLARRAMHLAAVVLATALLLPFSPQPGLFAVNLVSAQLAVITAGSIALLWTGARWMRSS